MGEDVYGWFDQPIKHFEYKLPLLPHQVELADHFLTYRYGIMAALPGWGKTLIAQAVMEKSGLKDFFWLGPKSSLTNIKREFKKWNIDPSLNITMMNYEALVRVMDEWTDGSDVPHGLIVDESSRCKGATSQRSQAVQALADKIRDKYGFDGYVIEMSGTPSPKSPIDWWKEAEIAWPGYLREGSPKAMENRLAFHHVEEYDAGAFNKRDGWKDDERKCKICGNYPDEEHDNHAYEPSTNEVAYLYERLKGLVKIPTEKDPLGLPDKHYRVIECKPDAATLRVAEAISQAAPSAIQGLTFLRELSDGFQYREKADGKTTCTHCNGTKEVDEWFSHDADYRAYQAIDMLNPDLVATLQKRQIPCPACNGTGEVDKMVRVAKEVPCPKDKAVRELLDECEETGRILIFAGFTASLDKIVKLCQKEKWAVVQCDGRGWQVFSSDGKLITEEEPLDYWANMDHTRVAFVANAASGGMSFTLVESRMAVFYSNSFKPEDRAQAEERIHRIGMDMNKGCTIVDLMHLPTDQKVVDVLKANQRLEKMTMGEITKDINWRAE